MKKTFAVILSFMLVLYLLPVHAESDTAQEQEELLEGYLENLEETDRSFAIPIGVGIIYSVILHNDSVGIVFTPIRSKRAAMSLEFASFMTDLKQITLHLLDGEAIVLPAVVDIKKYDVGTFITLNLSMQTASQVMQLIKNDSPVVRVTFTQNSNKEYDMSIDELNRSLSSSFDGAVDIINQVSSAISVFWTNLSRGIGVFASNAYSSVESVLMNIGDFFSGTASLIGERVSDAVNDAGDAINDAASKANDFFNDAASTAGDLINDASSAAGDLIDDAAEKVTDFWKGLFGK